MKKYIILLIVFFTFINQTFSYKEWECNINEWSADILKKYIVDLRTVITNVSSSLMKEKSQLEKNNWVSKDLSAVKNRLIKAYNLVIDWNWYMSYFNFYVTYSLNSEYVGEIWRDYKKLETESKWIDRYIKMVADKWYSDIVLDKEVVCKWVTDCKSWWTVLEILTSLYNNNEKLMDYYRLSIMWDEKDFDKEFLLVWDNSVFKTEFNKYYNKNTTALCSFNWSEGSFYKRAFKQIQNISKYQDSMDKWMKEWQEAINLMNWFNDKTRERQNERDLLRKELGRQWLSWKASAKILSNLDEYNKNWWFTQNNNFVSNSVTYFTDSVKYQVDVFNDYIKKEYLNKANKDPKKNPNTNLGRAWDIDKNLQTVAWINKKLSELYNLQYQTIWAQENVAEKYIWQIIELHEEINTATNIFISTKKKAEKVCDDQKKWEWLCKADNAN